MINSKIIIMFLAGVAILAWACKPAISPDRSAEEISAAVESGNYDHAVALTKRLMAEKSASVIDTMGVERLCILSVAAAKIGDKIESGDDYTSFALKCFRTALLSNPVKTQKYIKEMSSEDYRYISFLNQLLRPIDARESGVVYSINDSGEDSTFQADSILLDNE